MTEERLERFGGLKHEADALLMMLDKTLKVGPVMTTDAVASAAEFPYSKHTVVVSGLNLGEYQDDVDMLASRWRAKREAILDELVFLENYFDTVSDQMCIRDRVYIDGCPGDQLPKVEQEG